MLMTSAPVLCHFAAVRNAESLLSCRGLVHMPWDAQLPYDLGNGIIIPIKLQRHTSPWSWRTKAQLESMVQLSH